MPCILMRKENLNFIFHILGVIYLPLSVGKFIEADWDCAVVWLTAANLKVGWGRVVCCGGGVALIVVVKGLVVGVVALVVGIVALVVGLVVLVVVVAGFVVGLVVTAGLVVSLVVVAAGLVVGLVVGAAGLVVSLVVITVVALKKIKK